jgi:butyrate kinase
MNININILLQTPLSNIEIMKELGPNCRIIEYSELKNYQNIEQLLRKHKDYVIILIETTAHQIGHWVALAAIALMPKMGLTHIDAH